MRNYLPVYKGIMMGNKKKVMFVISSLSGGGAQRVVVSLINHLPADRYDVVLVLLEDKKGHQEHLRDSVKIVQLNKKSRWDFPRLVFQLMREVKHYQPQVVISFLHYVNIVTLIVHLLTGKKYKVIVSERNYPPIYLKRIRFGNLKGWLMKVLYRKADFIISNSKLIQKALEEEFHVASNKIKTIYNPVPLKEIECNSTEPIDHPFFLVHDGKIVISIGRFVPQKRMDRLVRAFALASQKDKNCYLIILGAGPLANDLCDLVKQLDIEDRVAFPGFTTNPYAWLAKCDLFVLSSDYEGFPNVILEAMACGVPVIATDCPSGPGEIITNGENGILVPLNNDQALAESMMTLLSDSNLRDQLGRAGKIKAYDFRVEKILPEYESVMV